MTAGPGYPDQARKRAVLRVLGLVCMGTALVLIALAVADFVHAFDADDLETQPTRFWYFFLALPFFVVGGFCLQAGFLGAVARYGAGETVPVVKDSAAFLTGGHGPAGLGRTGPAAGPYCRACGVRNDADARFCDSCGATLA